MNIYCMLSTVLRAGEQFEEQLAWEKLHIALRYGVAILCQTVFKDPCGDPPFDQPYVCTYLPRVVSCRNQ